MVKIIVDSSILIDHLRQKSERFIRLAERQDQGRIKILIPFIVVTELFVGRSVSNKKTEKLIDELLDKVELVGLTRKSAKLAGRLIQDYPQLNDPYDVLIAAIALEQKATVATLNMKHFKIIKDLKLDE